MIKKIFSILLLITLVVRAQVTVYPTNPTEDDSIRIVFDATQGGTGLLNYTGTVYTHTGLYTNLSPTSWVHVIGTWGNNTTQPALTRLSANLYELVIGKPRNFYNVTNVNEHITALNFVFRSSDASRQTSDIHVQIFSGTGIHVKVDTPSVVVSYGDPLRSPAFANPNDTVKIKISAAEINTKIQTLKLYLDDNLVQSTNTNTLSYNFIANLNSIGVKYVKAVGVDTSGNKDSTTFALFNNPAVTNQNLPAGTELGITYNSPTNVTLAFLAPKKKFVYLLSPLSDWKVDQSYFMKRQQVNQDSVIWWINLNVNAGTEYPFQYLVDGSIRTTDPYVEKVLDPWNDQYITSSTYPNLITYPYGKTGDIAGVFQTSQPSYNWILPNFVRPQKSKLVIYELLIRDFIATHTFNALADTLSYLKTLGINAVELMPVSEFEGNESWGYNVDFHHALDKYYGPKNTLKAFVDKCHQLGISVILDVVFNHVTGLSPLAKLYWDANNSRPDTSNIYLNPLPKHDFNVFNDMNHESNATRYYVDKCLKYWLTEYKVDGFRFDLSKGFTQRNTIGNPGLMAQYDQSRINNLTRIRDRIREYDSTTYLILEHFANNDEETVLAADGFMLWGNLNSKYNEATMGYTESLKSDLTSGSYQARGWNNPALVTYMESHDEERLMYKNILYGNAYGNYNIKDTNIALNRVKLAAAFFFTIPGPKMVWQFGELGYDYSIDFDCRTCNKPIRWDYKLNVKRNFLYKFFAEVIKLKNNYPVFSTTNYTLDVANGTKRINLYDPSMDVVIIGNFMVQSGTVNPNFSSTGTWYDYFSGDSITVTNPTNQVVIQAGEFHIYTSKRLPKPEEGLVTNINESNNSIVTKYQLEQNYPNPFNPSTTIKFALPKSGLVKLDVFNVLGQKVANLVNKNLNAGSHQVEFNAKDLPSGIYIYMLETSDFKSTKKMVLIK